MPVDFSSYVDDAVLPNMGNQKAVLEGLVKEQLAAEAAVESAEAALKLAKERLRDVAERRLPDTMIEMGFKKFETASGQKVQIKETLRGSISDGRRDPAIKWLEENGAGNLVKREFVIQFNKDEEAWAKKFEADLNKRKKQVRSSIQRNVHTGSVLSYLGELIERGKEVPLELFGAWTQKVAKITQKSSD